MGQVDQLHDSRIPDRVLHHGAAGMLLRQHLARPGEARRSAAKRGEARRFAPAPHSAAVDG